jgi:hypothetical protein
MKKNTIMKKSLCYYAAILFLALSSCHKETKPTVVNGTVVDKKTGAGIDHAVVTFSIYHQNNEPDHLYQFVEVATDVNGKFSYENSSPTELFNIGKEGYLKKGPGGVYIPILYHEINDITIPLIPIDGILRLNIKNVLGLHDSIFIGIYSMSLDTETSFSKGYVVFEKPQLPFAIGEIFEKDIPLASGENIHVWWSFEQPTASFQSAPFQDSIFIKMNEITPYSISF